MDPRIRFAQKHIASRDARILEIGPLNRQIAGKAEYPQSYTADIRTTEEVKTLYCGNDYLRATGISVDSESIVEVDYVLKGTYAETFQGIEKFDYVIASHVLEHVIDIISFFSDISAILKPGGKLLLAYPDKRFCFDHFRESSTFSEAYAVYKLGEKAAAPRVLDFFLNVVKENSPYYFWENYRSLSIMPSISGVQATEKYAEMLQGVKPDDVHYWPFSSEAFLRFMYDLTRIGLLPFTCVDFEDTPMNDQQFFLALQLDMSVSDNSEHALRLLTNWMQNVVDDSPNPEARIRVSLQEMENLRRLANDLANEKAELTQNLEGEQNDKQKWIAEHELLRQAHMQAVEVNKLKDAQLTAKEQSILQQLDIISRQQITIGQQQQGMSDQVAVIALQQAVISQQQQGMSDQVMVIDRQQAVISQQQQGMSDQDAVIAQQQAIINQLQKSICDQEAAIKQHIQEKNETQYELNAMLKTYSWRITKPIRAVRTYFPKRK